MDVLELTSSILWAGTGTFCSFTASVTIREMIFFTTATSCSFTASGILGVAINSSRVEAKLELTSSILWAGTFSASVAIREIIFFTMATSCSFTASGILGLTTSSIVVEVLTTSSIFTAFTIGFVSVVSTNLNFASLVASCATAKVNLVENPINAPEKDSTDSSNDKV